MPIQEGDTLELARVARGGIKLKFTMADDVYLADDMYDDSMSVGMGSEQWNPDSSDVDTRVTRQVIGDDFDAQPHTRKASEKIPTTQATQIRKPKIEPDEIHEDVEKRADEDSEEYDPSDQYF